MKANTLTKETVLDYGIQDRKFPEFKVGDTIEVAQLVKDGEKSRTQIFKGDVIAMHNNGIASTITVRKIGANNIGVEKIFPIYSVNVDSIILVKHGKVRRAKLTYLRDKVGKGSRIKERVMTKKQLENA